MNAPFPKSLVITWILLIGMTAQVYACHAGFWCGDFSLLPLGLTLFKMGLVLFVFMELRHAHPAWKWGALSFMMIWFLGLIALI
jgi:hypothetical protein